MNDITFLKEKQGSIMSQENITLASALESEQQVLEDLENEKKLEEIEKGMDQKRIKAFRAFKKDSLESRDAIFQTDNGYKKSILSFIEKKGLNEFNNIKTEKDFFEFFIEFFKDYKVGINSREMKEAKSSFEEVIKKGAVLLNHENKFKEVVIALQGEKAEGESNNEKLIENFISTIKEEDKISLSKKEVRELANDYYRTGFERDSKTGNIYNNPKIGDNEVKSAIPAEDSSEKYLSTQLGKTDSNEELKGDKTEQSLSKFTNETSTALGEKSSAGIAEVKLESQIKSMNTVIEDEFAGINDLFKPYIRGLFLFIFSQRLEFFPNFLTNAQNLCELGGLSFIETQEDSFLKIEEKEITEKKMQFTCSVFLHQNVIDNTRGESKRSDYTSKRSFKIKINFDKAMKVELVDFADALVKEENQAGAAGTPQNSFTSL